MTLVTKITGYGEYKLGTPISQYSVSKFAGPNKLIYKGLETDSYEYSLKTTLKVGGYPAIEALLSLFKVDDKLEAITFSVIDANGQFPDLQAIDSYAMKLRQIILDKYSHELVECDDFADETLMDPVGFRMLLTLEDEECNSLEMCLSSEADYVALTMRYQTDFYNYFIAAAHKRWEEYLCDKCDESKL